MSREMKCSNCGGVYKDGHICEDIMSGKEYLQHAIAQMKNVKELLSNSEEEKALGSVIERAERNQDWQDTAKRYYKRIVKLREKEQIYRKFFESIMDLQLHINYTEEELYKEVLKITDEFLLEESKWN